VSSAGLHSVEITFQSNDIAIDLYDFPARERHGTQGRWISPDPAGLQAADPTNPQTWNRYAYVLNNPLAYTDPQGLWCYYGTTDDNGKIDLSSPDAQDSGNYDFSIASGGTGVDKNCESGGTWYDPGENPFPFVFATVNVNGCPPGSTCFTLQGNGFGTLPANNADPTLDNRVNALGQAINRTGVQVLNPSVNDVKSFLCKKSSEERILISMRNGFLLGAVRGGIAGATGGAFFEGVGAIPGAILGGTVGGIAGAGGGAIKGGALAGLCSLARA